MKWPQVRGVDLPKHLVAADLSRILDGSRNPGAMILRGERQLTLPHSRKVAACFKITVEVLV